MLYQIGRKWNWCLCRIPAWKGNAVSNRKKVYLVPMPHSCLDGQCCIKMAKIELMPTENGWWGMLMLHQMDEILGWCQQKSGLRGARCWHQRGNMPDWCQHWPRFPQSSTRKRGGMIQQARRDKGRVQDKPSHPHEKEGEWYSKQGEMKTTLQTNPVINMKKGENNTAWH